MNISFKKYQYNFIKLSLIYYIINPNIIIAKEQCKLKLFDSISGSENKEFDFQIHFNKVSEPRKFSKSIPVEVEKSFLNYYPKTSKKILDKAEIKDQLLFENKDLMKVALGFKDEEYLFGKIMGPVGDTAMVLLWGYNIVNSFMSETDTEYDKACAVLGIVPLVGDAICMTQDIVDAKIFHERSINLINKGFYHYPTNNSVLAHDLNVAQREWAIAMSNFYEKHLPLLVRSIVEDTIVKYNNIHKLQVKKQTINLNQIFRNIDFELYKSLNLEISSYDSQKNIETFYGKNVGICKLNISELSNNKKGEYIKCVYNKIINPYFSAMINALNKIKLQDFNNSIGKEYFSIHKIAVNHSLTKIDWIYDNENVINRIKKESSENILKLKNSNWLKNINKYIYDHVYEISFRKWVRAVFNREPTQNEIFLKKVKVLDKEKNCFGFAMLWCYVSTEKYETFDENRDKDITQLKNYYENAFNNSINNLDSQINDIITGKDYKNSSWNLLQNDSINYFKEKYEILNSYNIFLNNLENKLNLYYKKFNNSKLYWRNKIFSNEKLHIGNDGKINLKKIDLVDLKKFIEQQPRDCERILRVLYGDMVTDIKKFNECQIRVKYIEKIGKLIDQNINLYYKMKFIVKQPYFSKYAAVGFSLEQHSPVIYQAILNAFMNNKDMNKVLLSTIQNEYDNSNGDNFKLFRNIGDFVRIPVMLNSISYTSDDYNLNHNGLFFSKTLPQEFMYYLSVSNETFYLSMLYNFYEKSHLISMKLKNILELIDIKYNMLKINDTEISDFCSFDLSSVIWFLNGFKEENEKYYIYYPHYENFFESIYSSVNMLDHNVKLMQNLQCNNFNLIYNSSDIYKHQFKLND